MLVLPLAVSTAAAAADDRAGCVVRMGDDADPGIVELSAECHWPVAHERVVEIVRDHDGVDAVLSSIAESTVLSGGRVLQVHRMGWGIAERQVTLRYRLRELEGGGLRVDFRRAQRQEPLAEGRVEIPLDRGEWRIRPDGAGGTRLRYAVRYDPGGSIRPWLVRRFAKSGIVRSMQEIRQAAERADARRLARLYDGHR
jgi:hypothetical protein